MICLLDDDLEDLKIMTQYLKEKGIKDIASFDKVDEFTEGIKQRTIVVVIDHSLNTGRTGLDVMKKVLEAHPICYPIIVSGNDSGKVIMEYMNNDGWRYIIKGRGDWLGDLVKYINQAKQNVERIAEYARKINK